MSCSCISKDKILKIKYLNNYKIDEWGPMKYSYSGDACFDARAAILKPMKIKSILEYKKNFHYVIPLGFKIDLSNEWELQIRMRSGLSKNNGLIMSNGIGTIDSGYKNEIMALISNLGNSTFILNPGDRIVQCKISWVPRFKLITVNNLSKTDRGENGFGSTGL